MADYTVLWAQLPLDQLVELWLAADDRPELNEAVLAIDAMLSYDPFSALSLDLSE